LVNNIEKSVENSDYKQNLLRDQNLAKLILEKSPYYKKTLLINLTDIPVPAEIKSLLEFGPNNPIGGYVKNEGSETYLGLESKL
jgi:hypothetical protein